MRKVGQEFTSEDRAWMVCLCSTTSRATTGGESTPGACNHLEASSFMGLPVDVGCQQGPQLSCGPVYLHMSFSRGSSVWPTLGFLIVSHLDSK